MGVWKREFIAGLAGGKGIGSDDFVLLALMDPVPIELSHAEQGMVDDLGGGRGILTKLKSEEFSRGGGAEHINDERVELTRNGEGRNKGIQGAKDST